MKPKSIYLLMFFLFSGLTNGIAQTGSFNRYIVEFRDKNGSPYSISSPAEFLSQRAIDRRVRYGIAVTENDLPVNPDYVNQVAALGAKVLNKSKWLNSISIETDDSSVWSKILLLPFVSNAFPVAPRMGQGKRSNSNIVNNVLRESANGQSMDYGKSANQLNMLHGEALHNKGYRGEGMQIAVMDIGFFNAPNLQIFDSLFQQHRVLGWWNFVKGNDSVFYEGSHGTSVLSTMAANSSGMMIGTAPGAGFYLFVTEDGASEYPIEEHNWAAAAEKADSLGVDLLTTSLAYSEFDDPQFNHTYEELDGNTTMITRAADFAASKGMIVCQSAGNEGNKEWHYITAPADADSILTVGAVDSLGLITAFSSMGPAADGDIKPNVVAQGIKATVVEPFSGTIVQSNGTSFSNPVIAGMTACLWQAHPEKSNMEIIDAIQKSASLYFHPNDSMGYGIPNYEVADLLLSGSAPDPLALTGALVYPNPFNDHFGILYYTARQQQMEVELFNSLGQKVQSFKTDLNAGYNYLPMQVLAGKSNELYLLRLKFDNDTEVIRMIKTD